MAKSKTHRILVTASLLIALLVQACSDQAVQSPFTQAEFDRFLTDATLINNSMYEKQVVIATPHKEKTRERFREETHDAIRSEGWDLNRFYYIYGRCIVYGTYERARRQAMQREAELEETVRFDSKAYPKLEAARKSHNRTLTTYREKLNQDIPRSEQVMIHERMDDVLHIVTKTAIHFFP